MASHLGTDRWLNHKRYSVVVCCPWELPHIREEAPGEGLPKEGNRNAWLSGLSWLKKQVVLSGLRVNSRFQRSALLHLFQALESIEHSKLHTSICHKVLWVQVFTCDVAHQIVRRIDLPIRIDLLTEPG